jgi:cell division protein FtsL
MKRNRENIRNLKAAGFWIGIMLIFIAELLFYTWSRVQCVQLGYEISNAAEIQRTRATLQNNLKIELARLKSPERIATIAKNQLGLIIPTPSKVITIP